MDFLLNPPLHYMKHKIHKTTSYKNSHPLGYVMACHATVSGYGFKKKTLWASIHCIHIHYT